MFKVYFDFPKEGVNFIDIFPIFNDPVAFEHLKRWLASKTAKSSVACADARGFLLAPLCLGYGLYDSKVLIPFRKVGKLPAADHKVSYPLEYGTATLECRTADIELAKQSDNGNNVAIVDDVLATGGTSLAMYKTLTSLGVNVTAFVFLADVPEFRGIKLLSKYAPVHIFNHEYTKGDK